MKIFLLASLRDCACGQSYARALTSFGHRVTVLNRENYFPRPRSLGGRIINRLRRNIRLVQYNRAIMKSVHWDKPDLLLVMKGSSIFLRTLQLIREDLPRLILFNINHDDYFSRSRSNYFPHLKETAGLYHCLFPTKKVSVPELLKIGAHQVCYLPFGYDPSIYFPVRPFLQEYLDYRSDIVFIGSYEVERARMLEQLRNYRLSIWSSQWRKENISRGLKRCVRKSYCLSNSQMDFSKVVNSCRISLNFFRRENRDTLNPRVFELAACGAFILSQRSEELAEYFEEDREIALFNSSAELRDKVNYYLCHREERDRIARAAYRRVRREKYTIRDRMRTILTVYERF